MNRIFLDCMKTADHFWRQECTAEYLFIVGECYKAPTRRLILKKSSVRLILAEIIKSDRYVKIERCRY